MHKIFKTFSLMFYFTAAIFFMETILRISATGRFFSIGLFFNFIFSMPLASILFAVCAVLKKRMRIIFTVIMLGLSAFLFSSQIIYFKFFKTFYTLYSAGNAGQVFQFWKDVLILYCKNIHWMIIILIPAIIFVRFRKKLIPLEGLNKKSIVILCYIIFISQSIGLASIYAGKNRDNSPYYSYFNDSPTASDLEKLGLVTTMRLDLQRHLGRISSVPSVSAMTPSIYTEEIEIEPVQKKHPNKIETQYNKMDIDFTKLIAGEKNEILRDMHMYFQSVQSTAKNEYTGRYMGYNLILLTAEGFSPYAVREDLTPTLYKLVHEGYNFTNFYNPIWGVSTSDGEYVACTGLIPKSGVWSFSKSGSIYMPLVMGNQLKKLGYKTMAYHDHTYTFYKRDISHPNMGYEYKGLGKGLELKKTWPESDIEMMEKTIPEYIGNTPFHTYYMTVSGHLRYDFTGNYISNKNRDYVEGLPYSEASKAYIACQIELDRALEYLMKKLEEEGIAEKTLIALSPDHYPYGLDKKQIDELAGHTVEKNFELYKSTFILYSKGMTPAVIDKPCSSLDIIPTLSNLLGLEYDSRLLMGRDIFSDSSPLVIFSNRSYITEKGKYNSETGEFTPVSGEAVDKDYIKKMSAVVREKFQYSARILETDYYSRVLKK